MELKSKDIELPTFLSFITDSHQSDFKIRTFDTKLT